MNLDSIQFLCSQAHLPVGWRLETRLDFSSVLCQSQSQSYFTTGGLPPISSSCRQARWSPGPEIFSLNSCGNSPYVTSSLTRRWVCLLWSFCSMLPNNSLLPLCTAHTENTASVVKKACLLIRCVTIDVLLLHALAPAGMCLPSRCLAMGIHVTICCTSKTGLDLFVGYVHQTTKTRESFK
jgi:hypothetical protein